jgi:phenylacetate-CoA ligase
VKSEWRSELRALHRLQTVSDRECLKARQMERLRALLQAVVERNSFYREKLAGAGVRHAADVGCLDDLARLPFTTKQELSADQEAHPPFGTDLTEAIESYVRVHQTSGTTGRPLRCLDTAESWAWWGRCWETVYLNAGVMAADRIFFAFSFGPFIGFWSAFEGARSLGALALPGGGMSSLQRLHAIVDNQATVLVSTPTYALHLAEAARREGIDLAGSAVRLTIHAGEPGANIDSTRRRIEASWGARAFDHAGATEVGAWGFECPQRAGLHLNEEEFIGEIIDPTNGRTADEGELVITNLGRIGMPVIRYRTGDKVVAERDACACGLPFIRFRGGVVGRIDDVLIIRGVNVFPSAIENIVRRFEEVVEFGIDVHRRGELDEIELHVELRPGSGQEVGGALEAALREALGLRAGVVAVAAGTLPRYELKAKRFRDHRHA